MEQYYLGAIGFSYKDWLGPFYPPGTPQKGFLTYYSKVFNAVELDTTFHSIPRKSAVLSWANSTPDGFRFCVKTPRQVTHDLGLAGAQGLMLEFLDSLYPLKEKLGPILIQLPPKYAQYNYPILADFLEALPKGYRYAVEFRHPSWYNSSTSQLLSQHHVCWVTLDYPELPRQIDPTTDFLYIRWIGVNGLYQGHSHERVDKSSQLMWWLDLIQPFLERIPTVYGFFNNDYAGFAAGTCRRFKLIAGLSDEKEGMPYQERFF